MSLLASQPSDITIRQAVSSLTLQHTVLAPLVSAYSKQERVLIHSYIFKELDRLQAYYNLPQAKRYDKEVLMDVAFDFMQKHKHETVEDFALFFEMIRHGKIKAMKFERFGFDTLQEAFSEYLTEQKIPELEKKHKKHKQDMDEISSEQAGSYADVLKTIEQNMKQQQIEKKSKRPNRGKSMTFEAEMERLKAWLPEMLDEELPELRKCYMNSSVMQHTNQELHPAIKLIDDEIARRG